MCRGDGGMSREMEYEEGQPCPKCNSDKISILETRQIVWERNKLTNKIIKRDKNGAIALWQFKCRKCQWISNCFTE